MLVIISFVLFVIFGVLVLMLIRKYRHDDSFTQDNIPSLGNVEGSSANSFDDNLDVLLKMVEREGGIDVWDFLENMCLVNVPAAERKQMNEFLSILEPKERQEVIAFFHPFNVVSSDPSDAQNALENGDKEPMERFSKILGKLARTPEWRVLKSDPNWQALRDIINKDRRESNLKEL